MGVVTDVIDLANVAVYDVPQKKHLEQGHGQGKEERARIATHMKRFFIKDSAESAKDVMHGRPPAKLGACGGVRRRHPRAWQRAGELGRGPYLVSEPGRGGVKDCKALHEQIGWLTQR